MRLDKHLTRLIQLSSFRLARPSLSKIPILMYHDVSPHPLGFSHPYFETTTTPEVFLDHMQFFYNEGYQVFSLTDAVKTISANIPCKGRRVVITFDDGYKDLLQHAVPIMEKFGFTATVFLITSCLDNSGSFKGRTLLSADDALKLLDKGFEFGSHTRNHPILHHTDVDTLRMEISESREQILNLFNSEMIAFSHPYALPEHDRKYLAEVEDLLKASGYNCGVTTRIGRAGPGDNRFFLKRIPVNLHDDLELLRLKLEGWYDWLYPFQKGIKHCKHFLSRLS